MTASRYGSRRISTAFVAALLYVATGVVLPVLHAETEVLAGPTRVEQGHANTCPRVHSDALCLLVASFHLPKDGPARMAPTLRDAATRVRPPSVAPRRLPTLTSLFVRAPPTA